MSGILASLLTVAFSLGPVMGTICAGPCDDAGRGVSVKAALTCEHADMPGSSQVLSAASCRSARVAFVLAEVRAVGPAVQPPVSAAQTALEPVCVPGLQRVLNYRLPSTSSRTVLRI